MLIIVEEDYKEMYNAVAEPSNGTHLFNKCSCACNCSCHCSCKCREILSDTEESLSW